MQLCLAECGGFARYLKGMALCMGILLGMPSILSADQGTTVRWEGYYLPAAELGPENPLPMFRGPREDETIRLDPAIPLEERRYLGWRVAWRCLPYRIQDGYNRKKQLRCFDALVLENETLRAVFLPNLGGRLVSLIHKPTQRELLARNPVFQPANLALRNAWFSGGIEWNTTLRGHYYLTCSPVFAAQVRGRQGEPVLRLYEWDRVRCFPWQIDFHLPPGSSVLFAHVRILNPHEVEIPMYWWTNIAVPERKDVRVLVPTETGLTHSYERGELTIARLPHYEGRDMTYTTQSQRAYDFFARIPDGQRRWIAALDGQGRGLFEVSTDQLRGRKIFAWGMSQGGRRWQEFLAQPGFAYLEIQAGLAQTQMECIPMPPKTAWAWTEAFGLLEVEPKLVHGPDWTAAWKAADACLEKILPRAEMAQWHQKFTQISTRAPERLLQMGSGWAALERRRCQAQNLPDPLPEHLPFPPESLGPEQAPWLALLEKGVLPPVEPTITDPGALMTQCEWAPLLEKSAQTADGNHWLTWWHLGNIRMEALDLEGAEKAWQASLACQKSGWALRNLAVLADRRGDRQKACQLLLQAWHTGPQIAPLAIEYLQMLTQSRRFAEVYDFVATLPEKIRQHERVQLLWARAAIELGRLEGVEKIFHYEFATIQEGEVSLTDLWFAWHEKRLAAAENVPIDEKLRQRVRRQFPPPRQIDFRMFVPAEK
ncbi:MAG: DUF5107 domain-containing protein [Thermoguttaceae bacterium]|nr:DUF5107 domain-containing protein [Thermoguttaceae bacterium]MDW8039697.1 DUF5107 domain-containing protein [Thermoguttaceae bacterium]